tara:strand:- start:1765 stop:2172 length:408 start_codon:yes stop_codon:yes gene_type:complete
MLLVISCQPKKSKQKKPSFLIGDWVRTNSTDSLKTYESWQKDFTGIGLTLKGSDTTFVEQLKILEKNDMLFFEVYGVNESGTLFKFTEQTATSFVCENPKNEFPKRIKYYIDEPLLRAEVSNESFQIDFVFERIE